MKKLFFLLFLILITPFSLPANENIRRGSVKGRVLDAETDAPLPGVNIMVAHTTIGTASSVDGVFNLSHVPLGEIQLIATMIGYKKDIIFLNINTDPGEDIEIRLKSTVLQLGGVVVTGTGTPHLMEDTPVRTQLIPRLAIRQKQACNLAEALSFQTGVRVENNCTNCNFSQVRILGLDGKYSQILIDGDPVVSSLAGVYGLEHIPEEMVDQIEVVKGGGSSLYGGGAVAGVVNIITRRPMQNQIRIRSLLHSTGGKTDLQQGVVAERISETGRSGAFIFGSVRKRNPYDHNHDGYSELGEITHESIGFKYFLNPTENSELLASFHRIHEERRGGNAFEKPLHEAEIAESVEHWRTGGTLQWSHQINPLFDYRAYISAASENRRSYYGGLSGESDIHRLEALAFYGRTENPMITGGVQANLTSGTHLMTIGMQHSRDELHDETAANTAYYIDEIYTNTGIFIQDDLHLGRHEQLEFVIGARMDKHSELAKWIFSPRVNAMLKLGGGLTLRGGATTGFKPPQTYDEDLHLCGVEGDQRIIRNSETLKEERSLSLSCGLEWIGKLGTLPIMASTTLFRTRINDSFTEAFVSKSGSIERWERVNSDGASVNGIEIDAALQPMEAVEIRGGIVYKKGRFDSAHEDFNTKNFLRTPDLTANMGITLPLSRDIKFNASAQYISPADVPHEIVVPAHEEPELFLARSDSFLQLDAGLTIDFHFAGDIKPKLNIGIKNITNVYQKDLDHGPDRDPAYTYGPIRPRTFHTGLEMTF